MNENRHQQLEHFLRSGHLPARTHTRAHVLSLSDRSQAQKRADWERAEAVMCVKETVQNVRTRFLEGRWQQALYAKLRSGQVSKVSGDVGAKLVMLACGDTLPKRRCWTLRLLAEKKGEGGYLYPIGHVTVWEKNERQLGKVRAGSRRQPSETHGAKRENVLDVYQRLYVPPRLFGGSRWDQLTVARSSTRGASNEKSQVNREDDEYQRGESPPSPSPLRRCGTGETSWLLSQGLNRCIPGELPTRSRGLGRPAPSRTGQNLLAFHDCRGGPPTASPGSGCQRAHVNLTWQWMRQAKARNRKRQACGGVRFNSRWRKTM